MKTHENLMSEADKRAVTARVREIAATVISTHAADRMDQKKVTSRQIEICLQYGRAVEVHNEAGEWRAVIRHAFGKPKIAVCVVIGIESGLIITTWKNAAQDNHSTLNLNAYEKVDIAGIFGRS